MKITKDVVLKVLRRDCAENQLSSVESYVERFPEYEGVVRFFFACQETVKSDASKDPCAERCFHGDDKKESQVEPQRVQKESDVDNMKDASSHAAERSRYVESSRARRRSGTPQESRSEFTEFRKIGEGGMGTVYEAIDVKLARRVAIKIVKPNAVPKIFEEDIVKRFEREAKIAARLNHENIATIYRYDAFKDAEGRNLNAIVMQMVDGIDLRSLISAKNERLSVSENSHKDTNQEPCLVVLLSKLNSPRWIAKIIMQVANALDYASRQGILHRDIKPANLMVDDQDRCKILDFGLAKPLLNAEGMETLTKSTQFIGTLRYLAPEAAEGKFSPASDVYSLGLTLYELLTLEPAFGATTIFELAEQVKKGKLSFDSTAARKIPAPLVKIIKKATRFNPKKRLSARAFSRALERYINRPKRLFIEILILMIVACLGLALLTTRELCRINKQIKDVTEKNQEIKEIRQGYVADYISGVDVVWLIPQIFDRGQNNDKNPPTLYSILDEGLLKSLGVVKKENDGQSVDAVSLFEESYEVYCKQLEKWETAEKIIPDFLVDKEGPYKEGKNNRVTRFIDEDLIKPATLATTYRLRQPSSLQKTERDPLTDSKEILDKIIERTYDKNASEQQNGRLRYRFLFAETELRLAQAYYQSRRFAIQRATSSSKNEFANFLYRIIFDTGTNTYALLKDRPDALEISERYPGATGQTVESKTVSDMYAEIRTLWHDVWPYRDFDPQRLYLGKSHDTARSLVDETSDELFYPWDFNVSKQALVLAIEYLLERSCFLMLTDDYDAAIASIETAQQYLDRYERFLGGSPEGVVSNRDEMLGVILGNYYYMSRSIAYYCKLRDSCTRGDSEGANEAFGEIKGSYVRLRETIDRGYEFNRVSGDASDSKGNLFNEYHLLVVELRMIYLTRDLRKLPYNAQNLESYCNTLDDVKERYNVFIDRVSRSLKDTNYEYRPPVWDKPVAQSQIDTMETNDSEK